jgi:hypothetical protein
MAKSFTVIDNSWDLTSTVTRWSPWAKITLTGFFPITVGSVEEMVVRLIAEAGSENIESLLILGHGYSGAQGIGCGRDVRNDNGNKSLKYDLGESGYHELSGDAKKHLRRLRGKFTNDAVISLGGCETAKGDEGKKLLSLVSFETNTYVEAGDENQRPLVPGWEGNVIRCYRNTHWVAKTKFSLF